MTNGDDGCIMVTIHCDNLEPSGMTPHIMLFIP